MKTLKLLLALCLWGATTPTASAQFWNLPGLTPSDASGDGSVVVGDNGGTGQYFEWTAKGGATDIGGVVAGGGVGGQAKISDDAVWVGGTDFDMYSGFHQMSIYNRNANVWTPLGGIGKPCSTEISSGWGISGDGRHMVGLGWLSCADAHAVQWSNSPGEGGLTDLGSSVPDESSRANAVSDDGTVVAGWQDGAGREAAVWINGVQTVISGTGEAAGVSGDGEWVVGIGGSATMDQGWRWSEGTGLEPLGCLTGDCGMGPFSPRGFATAINGDGSVIVGFDRGFGGPPSGGEGWVWTESGGFTSLDDYVASFGVKVPADIRLALPLGVSADGKTFVGLARQGPVAATGFVVTVPEPSSLMLLLLGVLAVVRRR